MAGPQISRELRQAAERELDRLLKEYTQKAKQTIAAREFDVEVIGLSGVSLRLAEIGRQVAEGDQGAATSYAQEMILAIKSLEGIPNLPAKELQEAASTIISDVVTAANNDPLLSPEAKKEVTRIAGELSSYVNQRSRLSTRVKDSTRGFAKRVKSGLAESMRDRGGPILGLLGMALQRGEKKEERQRAVAQARFAAAQSVGGAGAYAGYEERESAIQRLANPRGDQASNLLKVNTEILNEIRRQRKDAEEFHEDDAEQAEQDREEADRKGERIQTTPSGLGVSPIRAENLQRNQSVVERGLFDKFGGLMSLLDTAKPALGILTKGSLVVGAALAGWEIGKMIDQWTGASDIVQRSAEWLYSKTTGQLTAKEQAEAAKREQPERERAFRQNRIRQAVTVFGANSTISFDDADRMMKEYESSGFKDPDSYRRAKQKKELEVLPSKTLPLSSTNVLPSVSPNIPSTRKGRTNVTPATMTESPTSTTPTRVPSEMLAAIRSHEQGAAGYDSTLGNGAYRPGGMKDETEKPITNMSLGELYQVQSAILRNPNNKFKSSAVGAYQFTQQTLFGKGGTPDKPTADSLVGKTGLTKDTKFTPELQDQLAVALIERRANQAQRMSSSGRGDFESSFQTALSQEWASIQDTTGQGYYANQKGARTDIRQFISPQLITQMSSGSRASGPVQAGTTQLAQAQMQAPVIMAVNAGASRQAPAPAPTPMPVPIRPRSQDDTLRALQTINAV
jgi:muramidase (phage lysozyme)